MKRKKKQRRRPATLDVMQYDPLKAPDPETWLELDEQERMAMVESCHYSLGIELPNSTVHAVIHTVVENQLAMDDAPVQEAFNRLLAEGLDRHDALHAVGSVLAELMLKAIHKPEEVEDPQEVYYRELAKLTAASWWEQADDD